ERLVATSSSRDSPMTSLWDSSAARSRALWGRAAREIAEVFLGSAPRQDAPHRVRSLRRRKTKSARTRETGDLHLSWLHAHVREDESGEVSSRAANRAAPDDGEATRGESRTDAQLALLPQLAHAPGKSSLELR